MKEKHLKNIVCWLGCVTRPSYAIK